MMFLLRESLRSALRSIAANRMRSFLTSLGIIVGVASVIAVISLVQGLSRSVTDQFQGLGGNTLTVKAHNNLKDVLRGKRNALRFDDVEQLQARVDEIREVSPAFSLGNENIQFRAQSFHAQVLAVTPSYQDVRQSYTQSGRFLTAADEAGARRVAVIGEKLIERLELPANPLGSFIHLHKEWFKVVGVLEKRGELFGISQDEYVVIPFKTGRSLIGNNEKLDNMQFILSLHDLSRLEEVKPRIATVLRAAHRLAPEARDDFDIESSDQLAKTFDTISNSVTFVMAAGVGIALFVGGIGIMNIMLVSVTERTREIGICKALGARRRDILMQFLIESVLLSVMGGVIGLACGYAVGYSVAKMIPGFPDAVVPWWAAAVALFFSGGVGILFGVFPASKAANLDPIEALRYE